MGPLPFINRQHNAAHVVYDRFTLPERRESPGIIGRERGLSPKVYLAPNKVWSDYPAAGLGHEPLDG
jgi:hypothetical protein